MPESITYTGWIAADDSSLDEPLTRESGSLGIRWGRVLAVAAALFLAFSGIEHEPENFAGSQIGDNKEDRIADDYIDGIEGGSSTRQWVIILYGLGGVWATAACRQREWNLRWSGVVMLGLLFSWALLSVFWSDEAGLSAKRVIIAILLISGSLGLARALRPNELLAVAISTLLAFVSYSFLCDLGAGAKPWSSAYRFSGTLHPNIQAAYCAVLCLAAWTFPGGFGSRWITRGIFAYGFVLLVLTQSRTSLLAMLVGLLMVFVIRLSPTVRLWAVLLMLSFASIGTVVVSSLDAGGRRQLEEVVLLGRTDDVGSLTGRVPLWNELAKHAAKQPLQGYGYETFWTPKRIDEVMKSQKWAIQSAHNAYFEVVLQLGFIGLALAVGLLLVGFNLNQSAYARTREAGYAFAYGVMAFAMANSLLESHFAKLKYPTALALIALLSVSFFYPSEEQADNEALRLQGAA